MTLNSSVFAFAALSIFALMPVNAAPNGDESECFDAQIYASIIRQTPTIIPDCGSDCIIMRWPWILELNVKRVLKGTVSSNNISVLTVQHTYIRTDIGSRRWWLRRNALGTFNVLAGDQVVFLTRCPRGSDPARPYISPPTGKTLADLAREGELRYGKHR